MLKTVWIASIAVVTALAIRSPLVADRVAFVGDSITAQWNVSAAFPTVQAVNMGTSGDTSDMVLARFRQAIEIDPDVVVIEVGVNDMRHSNPDWLRLFGNIVQMSRIAHSIGARVIVLDVPRTFGSAQTEHTDTATITRVNEALRGAADIEGYEFLPAFALLGSDDTADGLHPNERGYRKLTEIIGGHTGWTTQRSY